MKRIATFSVLGLLTACAAVPDASVQPTVMTIPAQSPELSPGPRANAAVCRIGPDQGPVVADRGIGGTGAPLVADRGIGGTGIIGVITGFASICVNGLEVQYDASVRVEVDGAAASIAALRAGQVVIMQAQGSPNALRTRAITVRREVVGRIESSDRAAGTLIVAGQPVSIPAETWGASRYHTGDWVAVSGLRRPDGMIVATRLEAAPADTFALHGQIRRDGDNVRIGTQSLHGAATADLVDGQFVSVSGHYVAGQGQISVISADTLFPNPAAYFTTTARHMVIQAFVHVANNLVSFNGLTMPIGAAWQGQADHDGMAVVSLERNADGAFSATGLQYRDDRHPPEAAPQPARAEPSPHDRHASPPSRAVQPDDVTDDERINRLPAPATVPNTPPADTASTASSPPFIAPQAAVPETPPVPPVSTAPETIQPAAVPSVAPSTTDLISSNPPPAGSAAIASATAAQTGPIVRPVRSAHKLAANRAITPPTISLATGAAPQAAATTAAPPVAPAGPSPISRERHEAP